MEPEKVIFITLSSDFSGRLLSESLLRPAIRPIRVTTMIVHTNIDARKKPSADANIILKNCFIWI